MKRLTAIALALGLLAVSAAAATVTWNQGQEGLKQMRQHQAPAVLFFPGEAMPGEPRTDDSIPSIFRDEQTVKMADDRHVTFVWLAEGSPLSEELRPRYKIDEGKMAIAVVDFSLKESEVFFEDMPYRHLYREVRSAESRCKKLSRNLEKLHKAFEKGRKYEQAGATKQAIAYYQAVIEPARILDPTLADQAQAALDALHAQAKKKLEEVDGLIKGGNFPEASKALSAIKNDYPFPDLDKEIMERRNKIAREVQKYNNP